MQVNKNVPRVKLVSFGGSKGQVSLNFNYKVNLKDCIRNVECVLTNKRYKTCEVMCLYHVLLCIAFCPF